MVALIATFGGCGTGSIAVIGQSPIAPGIYVGERKCTSDVNGSSSMNTDMARFTIDNDGLLVLHGETIHIGLVNDFQTGAAAQHSTIRAITVTADGFTIDWDTTITVNGAAVTGFVLESFKMKGSDSFEFRSSLTASSPGLVYREDCSAALAR